MYEAEVNHSIESIGSLPVGICERFAEFRERIAARTILPWGEHCTECVWPTCYTTCDLYSPRQDGACRQFVDGMVRIDHKEGLSPYLLKIQFKRWGKLWTVGNLRLRPLSQAGKQELFNIAVGAIGRNAPLPATIKARLMRKVSYLRRQAAERAKASDERPDWFLLECYNPSQATVALTLTLRNGTQKGARPFQTLISVAPGYTRAQVPFSEISYSIDTLQPFEVEVVPNDCENAVLYFGLMEFVKERREAMPTNRPESSTKKWKCIVWDLDNTFWDGILIEDGPGKIRVRQGVLDVIRQTDERGILHSIASKNNYDDAMQVLRSGGLDQYFLHPQIAWQPKSQSLARIAQLLNIGIDAVAFVDDQEFEREEVRAGLPQVTVIDAASYATIPSRPECDVPVTAESKNRRLMYREEEQRQTAFESSNGDYIGFLRSCRMTIEMRPLDEDNLKRVYELAQRTNQMNFSGNRYKEEDLRTIIRTDHLDSYVIDCRDRFGNYGIIGLAIVDTQVPRLLDLMFSCRIQGKRVEHAVLAFLLKRFACAQGRDFYANYRRTSKNSPAGKVFAEIGFERVGEDQGVASLIFRQGRDVPDYNVVQIETIVARNHPCNA